MKNKNYLSTMAQKIVPYEWEFGAKNELRFNSNTLALTPRSLKEFLRDLLKDCPINEYSDPTYKDLKKLLADYEGVKINNITITNSGDEAIDILAKTFLNPDDKFITTPPTYEMFSVQSEINRGINLPIPLELPDFSVNAEKIIAESQDPRVKMIFLCNPNNPTASVIPQEIIEKIIKKSDAIVVVDETYKEFYDKTVVPLINKYQNLVVLRSFSKFAAMAGARVGFLLANPALSQKFDGIRFPMGVSFFSYKLAEKVLKNDKDWIKKQIKSIKKERENLAKKLEEIGFFVYPSETNFLLVKIGARVKEVYLKLKEKGIYIRDRSSKKNLEGCVRITVRSPKENKILIKAIKEVWYEK